METAFVIAIVFIIVIIIVIFQGRNKRHDSDEILRRRQKDKELLETVTTLDRGTGSEQLLILMLLKHGISPQAIFHDLYVKTASGSYAQIDLVVATKAGIIVFEDKCYGGWIFGNGNQENWTQVLAHGQDKFRFYNPIKQNSRHIMHLQKLLGEKVPFYSVIVFNGNCVLKEITNVPNNTFVVQPQHVLDVVDEIMSYEPTTYKNKVKVATLLKQAVENGKDAGIRAQHAEHVGSAKESHAQ